MKRGLIIRYLPGLLVLALSIGVIPIVGQTNEGVRHVPTIDELLELKTVSEARISPDGKWVAYLMRETNFQKDTFTAHIWLADVASGKSVQLTRGESSCTTPRWSPDGKWLAFLSNRIGKKSQIFALNMAGGEAIQLTSAETGVSSYQWSPDGKRIAFLATDPASPALKGREERWGDYEVAGREHSFVHVWTVDVETAMNAPQTGQRLTEGELFSVNTFSWSPDGERIAFSAAITPELKRENTEDLYVVNLADHSVKKIVSQPGIDSNPIWSPDGKLILFNSFMGRLNYFAMNSELAIVPAEGGAVRSISDNFDEIPTIVVWNQGGIYFNAYQKTAFHLFRIDPADQRIERVTVPDDFMGESEGESFTFSRDGTLVAFIAKSPVSFPEVCVSRFPFQPRALTDMTKQADPLLLGTREVVSWKSKDGTEIEGILIKPRDFDPSKKHPPSLRPSRRSRGNRPPGSFRPRLSRRHLGGPRSPDPQSELSRKRGLRGEIPPSQYPQPRNRRRLGRYFGSGRLDQKRMGRSGSGRLYGLEPRRIHLGVFIRLVGQVPGVLGRSRNLGLGHQLLQQRSHAVHGFLPGRESDGRSRDL